VGHLPTNGGVETSAAGALSTGDTPELRSFCAIRKGISVRCGLSKCDVGQLVLVENHKLKAIRCKSGDFVIERSGDSVIGWLKERS
jgi:DUF1009 family protein